MRKFKINFPHENLKAGDTVSLEFKDGYPVNKFWRRRYEDSKIDNCMEEVLPEILPKKAEKKGADK